MYLHDWYQSLFEQIPDIQEEAAAFAEAEGLGDFAGSIGT
ncbi:unnamed protein product, partial [Ectocarpus sp. 12 AP-2014]